MDKGTITMYDLISETLMPTTDQDTICLINIFLCGK